MASLFSHLWMFLILCYLISKNLYSLQNAQPFIFQLICIQLYKSLNCFFKTHNKQLNQYCLNFIIFLPKKRFYKMVRIRVGLWVRLGWPAKNTGWVTGQPIFASGQKIGFGLGQKILTCFAMSTQDKSLIIAKWVHYYYLRIERLWMVFSGGIPHSQGQP